MNKVKLPFVKKTINLLMFTMRDIIENIQIIIKSLESSYYKLLLVVGDFNSGKTQLLKKIAKEFQFYYINFNLEVSKELLTLTKKERNTYDYYSLFQKFIMDQPIHGLILDNIEIIFHPDIKRNPLKFFRELSRNKVVIVSWPGKIVNNNLVYGEPSHKEYFESKITDTLFIDLNGM